jgi:phosphopantetheinyl transferase
MPLVCRYISGEVEIAVWEIVESEELLVALSGDAARAAVKDIKSAQRRCERLAVRLLLKELLGDEADIVYDACGKPLLVGGGACISVSHTRGYAAVALCRSYEVGLDIEPADRVVGAVCRRFMREEELEACPPLSREKASLIRWTASEAVYKLVGDLGGNYRDNIFLEQKSLSQSDVLRAAIINMPRNDEFFVKYLFDGALLLTLCHSRVQGSEAGLSRLM